MQVKITKKDGTEIELNQEDISSFYFNEGGFSIFNHGESPSYILTSVPHRANGHTGTKGDSFPVSSLINKLYPSTK